MASTYSTDPIHVLVFVFQDTASSKKKVLEGEYQQISEMLDREEREALNTVDREQESGQTKLQGLMKKFDKNIDKMSGARDDINNLLSQSESLAFLQVKDCFNIL